MKQFLIVAVAILFSGAVVLADTSLSRDGEGTKISGWAPAVVKTASIGTKGFKCFSTVSRIGWEVKVTETDTTDAAMIPFKYSVIVSATETAGYPVSTAFFQWMNSPLSRVPTITKVCLRSYSSATEKTAYGIFQ